MLNDRKAPVGNVGYYHSHKYHSIEPLHRKMTGTRRVILFCLLVVFMPAILLIIPLYIKNTVYGEVVYKVTESDVLEINDGISNVFCSKHYLRMNDSFNAFQMSRRPETTSYRKHIRLKKSMTLPDDTLEYWGFYLLKGATVALSVCSRFHGASILVVRDEQTLRTCGMLDHNKNKALTSGIYLPEANQVKIIFESNAQEINSKEFTLDRKESSYNDTIVGLKNKNNSNKTDREEQVTKKINDGTTVLNIQTTMKMTPEKTTTEMTSKTSTKKSRDIENAKSNTDENDENNHNPENDSIVRKRFRLQALEKELQIVREDIAKEENIEVTPKDNIIKRRRRNHNPQNPPIMLDQGIKHGGNNAVKNATGLDEDSSISSFENGLLTCYNGNILVSQEFDPSEKCLDVSYLMNGKHMQTIHDVREDGYYYYIFYSDNDIVSNDIHAVFDIYKPTLQYENVTNACINKTECTFNLKLFSKDRVIVEAPTMDGIDHEIDDNFLLISVCHPRMEIYAIFPIAILIFILGCAFI